MPRKLFRVVSLLASTSFATACSGDLPVYLGPTESLLPGDGGTEEDAPSDAATSQAPAVPKDASSKPAAADASASLLTDAGPSGLPCDVDALLRQSCRTCHGVHLIGGAPMTLMTYAQLLAPAPTDKSKTVAQRSLEMMQASTMPPGGGLAASDLSVFATWVQNGTPMGSCGADAVDAGLASDPYDTPVTCTSNKMWTGGNRESPLMHPGDACISCHSRGEGPAFALAGTLYPTAHEPIDCNGSSASGASVIITDASGTDHTLTPNAAGNFYLSGSFKKPYSAKLVYQGRTRVMVAKQSDGDCNGCHTESGDNGAPGRLMLP